MKNLKKIVKFVFILSISFLLLNSCKKKEDEEVQPKKIEINEQTKVMPDASREHIESIDTNTYTFVFNGTDDFINGLEVGNILVDGVSDKAPYGYLRKITAITENKGNKQCQTELVTLPEAVPTGSIYFNSGKLKISDVKSMTLAEGVKLNMNKDPNFTVFDFTFEKVMVDPDNPDRKVSISGETALELEFFFNFDWDWDIEACPTVGDPLNGTCIKVKIFETGAEITQSGSISIAAEVGANFEEQIDLATYIFDPWVFQVGPVPVVLVPKIKVILKANGEIVAIFSASASERFTGRLGVKYENGNFDGINEWEFDKDFVAPQLEIDAKAEAHIGPEVSLLLYGVAGPYISLTACDKFEGTLNIGTGNWDLDFGVGIAAEIGLHVDLLGWEKHVTYEPPKILGVSNIYCLGYWSLLHLENESFDDHIYIAYPTDGSGVSKDSDVTILTEFTGQTPDEVQFFIDGSLLGSDTDEPFEYIWHTTGYALGAHTITVKEFAGGDEISSDEANVIIENAHWEVEDLSSVMSQSCNFTRFQSMDFKGSDRWISGTYAENQYECSNSDVGFLWHSSDNGTSWEELYTYPYNGFMCGHEKIQKIQFINTSTGYMIQNAYGGNAAGHNRLPSLHRTSDGGNTFTLVSYEKPEDNVIMYQFKNFMINNSAQIVGSSFENGYIRVYDFDESLNMLLPSSSYDAGLDFDKYNLYGLGNTILTFDYYNPKYIVSNDGGYNWNENTFPTANYQYSYIFCDASFVNESIGFLSLKGEIVSGALYNEFPIILKTIDGGNSWEVNEITSLEGSNSRFDFIHFASENIGYAWGNEYSGDDYLPENLLYAGIYKTTDGGQTWNRHYEIPEVITRSPENILSRSLGGLFFNGLNEGYAIGHNDSHKIYHFTVD